MRFEDVAHEGKCDCCGKESLVVCCASRLGPVSLCYCKTCHSNGIEPYDMLVTSIAMAGDYPEGSREAMKLLVHNNLIFYKKKDAEFLADVKKARNNIGREG